MKALVLSSGGVDSTTCIGAAIDKYGKENVSTVCVYYGQKHDKEIKAAEAVAEYYNVKHYSLNLSEIFKESNCSLLSHSTQDIDHSTYEEQIQEHGKVLSYVPFRNGLMLSAVASLAMSIYPDEQVKVVIGAHADDAAGNAYPDCSVEFTSLMSQAISSGTYNLVDVWAPLVKMNKSEVVRYGKELNVPYYLTWSCYEGNDEPCGQCGTCLDRMKAFDDNGIKHINGKVIENV